MQTQESVSKDIMPKVLEKDWKKVDSETALVLQRFHKILNPIDFITGQDVWKSDGMPGSQEIFFDSTWLRLAFEEINSLTPDELARLSTDPVISDFESVPYTKQSLEVILQALLVS